jgi:hypothetical protein
VSREEIYRTGRAGDLSAGVRILRLPKPLVYSFATTYDHADRSSRYLARPSTGYKVTNTRRVEVEVGAEGPASAPFRGRRHCAAGGRRTLCCYVYLNKSSKPPTLRYSLVSPERNYHVGAAVYSYICCILYRKSSSISLSGEHDAFIMFKRQAM